MARAGYRFRPRLRRFKPACAVLAVLSAAGSAAAQQTIAPESLHYLGAFRLPGGEDRPLTFAYGGNAMTYNPDGDPTGPADGFPGSLFVTGHDRMAYGELPDGDQVAEITIPVPVRASTPAALGEAGFVQPFRDIAAGWFAGLDEIPRVAMQYLNAPPLGARIHLGWGQHLQDDEASHALFSPGLSAPAMQGPWSIADVTPYATTGYMLEIPADWAAAHTQGRVIGTGRYRDGGWSGMGPALFAYAPWTADGTLAAAGARLPATTLLHYRSSTETERIEGALAGYQHPDEWEGAAWLTTTDGRAAVLFAGTKAVGSRYWYGFVNPAGAERSCVAGDFVGEFPVCRLADGSECPAAELVECTGHNDFRGWWSTRFAAQLILYDPADLAAVADGTAAPWQPQPYAAVSIDDVLFLDPPPWDVETLGAGPQRRLRIGDAAYDRERQILYVLELFADGAKPVVHVWRID
ncbi:MAG: hypothetical protein R3F55_20340 [Alphaproteobacteria bacterium]